MPERIKWDDFRFVLAVADAGSVNAAASKLGVNHATILRRIASFETTHGISVFEKSAAGYRVSPDCIQIIEAIRGVDKSVDTVERIIAGKTPRLNGIVQLTSTDSLSHVILPDIIREFQAKHPDLTIVLNSTNTRLNLAKLDAEVTVRPAKSLLSDLTGENVGTMNFSAYATPEYLKMHTSRDTFKHWWLGVTEVLSRSPAGQWLDEIPPERIIFKTDSFLTLANIAETGMGIAILPSFLAAHSQKLLPVPMFPEKLGTPVWVASHTDLASSENVAVCVEFLTAKVRAALRRTEDRH